MQTQVGLVAEAASSTEIDAEIVDTGDGILEGVLDSVARDIWPAVRFVPVVHVLNKY